MSSFKVCTPLARLAMATMFVLAVACLATGRARSQTSSPAGDGACGFTLGPAVAGEWRSLGGQGGRLGCPLGDEAASSTSPRGSAARQATFANGTILLHTSGPRAGQVFAVVACYRLYFQFGGPSGWLGLPIGDAINTPDGQRQAFEGGTLTLLRAPDSCEATHASEEAAASAQAAAPPEAMAPLDLFKRDGDFVTASSQAAVARATADGYGRVGTEAYVFAQEPPGGVPLKLYADDAGARHETVATSQGEREAQEAGLAFAGLQGFVWAGPAPGARPLKQYRRADGATLLVATPQGEADAAAGGFAFVRVEGYAPGGP